MYGSWNDASCIGNELQASQVNAQEVLNQAQAKGIGYLAWSWTGNDSANSWLDLVSNNDWQTFTSWGNLVFNGTNGIKATAVKASVFNTGGSSTLYDFEGSNVQGWTGSNITGEPWSVTEWSSSQAVH